MPGKVPQVSGDRLTPWEFARSIREDLPRPKRVMAPFVWYGGKGNLAPWIVKYLPAGQVYVEPFAGAANVFWHLPQPYAVEVLNDLDGEIINFFRVLQDPAKFEALAYRLTWTPYALDEFCRALEIGACNACDDVERAWAFFVRQNQGFSGTAITRGNWSRAFVSRRGMAATTSRWLSKLALLDEWHARLMRVQLDNRDALEVIRYWDSDATVFYLDPPYVPETRVARNIYAVEQDAAFHERLVDLLLTLRGRAVLSGYPNAIYKRLEDAGWETVRRRTVAHAAGRTRGSGLQGTGTVRKKVPRTEMLWISP